MRKISSKKKKQTNTKGGWCHLNVADSNLNWGLEKKVFLLRKGEMIKKEK